METEIINQYERVPPLQYICEGSGAPEFKVLRAIKDSRRVDVPPILGYDPTLTLLEGADAACQDALDRGLGQREGQRRRDSYYRDNVRCF